MAGPDIVPLKVTSVLHRMDATLDSVVTYLPLVCSSDPVPSVHFAIVILALGKFTLLLASTYVLNAAWILEKRECQMCSGPGKIGKRALSGHDCPPLNRYVTNRYAKIRR